MVTEKGGQPFFTIGVTTYNRHDLLRQTLASILAQGFTDFEVIVGNDYTEEVLTGELLGINDPRIRFVNHPRNLREVGNMNALLAMAGGRYFTWLFDDDLYEPDFLQTAHACLVKTGFPSAFFSSFRMLPEGEKFQPRNISGGNPVELTGREFLRRYSASRPEIVSTCGLFDTEVLRSRVGGVEELCSSAIGVYCEYLFLVRCGLLDRIVYLHAPFVLFRVHSGSWSESDEVYNRYLEAGSELVRRCAEVLRQPALVPDFDANLLMICRQHLITIAHRAARLEAALEQVGIDVVWRALARYRREASATRKTFLGQGGARTPGIRLAFMAIDFHCYHVMLLSLGSFLYRRFRGAARPAYLRSCEK